MSEKVVGVSLVARTSAYIARMRAAAAANQQFGASTVGPAARTATMTGRMNGLNAATLGIPPALIGAGGVVFALKKTMGAGVQFEAQMTRLETLVGLSSETVDGMKDSVLGLAGDTARAPAELADAMFFITSAGLRGADAVDALEASAKGAAIGLGSTRDIANLATSAMNAYGVENLSAAEATDILGGAVRAGKVEASEMAGVMGRLLPTASALNIPFEDIAGTMAVMSRTGAEAAESSTSLGAIMSTMLKPSKEAADTLAEVGLNMGDLREMAGREGGLLEVMRLLAESFDGNDEALAAVIPNVRAFRGVMNVLAQDAGVVDQVMHDVANSTGLVGEAHDRYMQTAAGQWDQLKANIAGASTELGEMSTGPLAWVLRDLNATFTPGTVGHAFFSGLAEPFTGGWGNFFGGFVPEGMLGEGDPMPKQVGPRRSRRSEQAGMDAWGERYAGQARLYADAVSAGEAATARFENALHATANELWRNEDGVFQLSQALNDMVRIHLSAESAAIRWEAGLGNLADAITGGSDALDINTEKGRDNRQAMVDLAGDLLGVIETRYDEGASLNEVAGLYDDMIGQYRDTAREAGLTEDQVDELIATYGLTPKEVITNIVANDQASSIIGNVINYLGRIPKLTTTTIRTEQETAHVGSGRTGYRSSGGYAAQGSPYWMGEDGPEIFIPETAGSVVNATDSKRLASQMAAAGGSSQPSRQVEVSQTNYYGDGPDAGHEFDARQRLRVLAAEAYG